MDFIVIDGDTVEFESSFGDASVVVQSGTMIGSGHGSVDGYPMCIDGDEGKMVPVGPVAYTTKTHTIPGQGLLSIDSLASDQLATQTSCDGTAVILVGSKFNAKFTVVVPAMQPQSPPATPTPDNNTEYKGFGTFSTQNDGVRGE